MYVTIVDCLIYVNEQPVHRSVVDQVADSPVGLRVGELVDQDQDQVVGDKLAAGEAADRLAAGGGEKVRPISQPGSSRQVTQLYNTPLKNILGSLHRQLIPCCKTDDIFHARKR